MAKLYFRFGTVGSAKTMNLLAVAHSYQQQHKRVFLIKPALDDRFGKHTITSRCGLEKDAHLAVHPDTLIDMTLVDGIDCVLVDEAQFLSPELIEQLRDIATNADIPVICYGLRTDFRRQLFTGSQRLMELADQIEEIKMTCAYCTRKAIYNLKLRNGQATIEGPTIDLGCEEKYLPCCAECYGAQVGASSKALQNLATAEHRPNYI